MTFDDALAALEALGFRVDMIMPADDPHVAELSNGDTRVRLDAPAPVRERDDAWHLGRAGMQYRDLIPDRLGGRVIASHIRVPDGGPVPDYVHYHKIEFQMIYCAARCGAGLRGRPGACRRIAGSRVARSHDVSHRRVC